MNDTGNKNRAVESESGPFHLSQLRGAQSMQDFGYLGVVLITAIIAGISVRIYRKAKREPSINNQLAYFYVLHVILFASVWWELRRSDIVATMLHNLWIMPLIGLKVRGKKNGKV